MTPDQQAELERIREQQRALSAACLALEQRIDTLLRPTPVTASAPIPPPFAVLPPRPPPPPPPAPAATPMDAGSLEMQIGTQWLVRASVVLLLTSLAFFGNYAYHHVVPHLGQLAKVGLLYLAAGALAGFGAWLERSRQAAREEPLRNFARVVLAGGLAAVYYVTYAAHWNPSLRVLDNALLDGGLLLAWATFMVWLADRRESEVLATFAILLAYYTSAINEIATFTLFSNLALSAGGVYLIRRHLWRVFPFASLLATYGSYGFWRYFHFYTGSGWLAGRTSPSPDGTFWIEGSFLLVYWALFTWTVLDSDDRVLPAKRRIDFITLNNGAFFLLTTWLLLGAYPGSVWKWLLLFGAILAGIGEAGRRWRPTPDPTGENAYQTQGLALITLGLIDYFSGWHLSLILAFESRFLLAAAQRRGGPVLPLLSALTSLAAVLAAAGALVLPVVTAGSQLAALVVSAGCLESSWRCERSPGVAKPAAIGPFFSILGCFLFFLLLESAVTFEPARAPVLAGAAILLLLLGWLVRLAVVKLSAQVYLLAAQVHWLYPYVRDGLSNPVDAPGWSLALLLLAVLVGGELWKKAPPLPGRRGNAFQVVLMTLAVGCGWVFVSRGTTLLPGSAFNLAARWSLYAAIVFLAGLGLRERVYRWLGLGLLVATLGRVVIVDIWQIDQLARALSLLTLGLVLLAIGFFYTRFGSKLRDLF